jgi:SAM-dependent methyltransferase
VLDAGCGTGRVAIELARHGIRTLGVDVDASMLAEARRQASDLEWLQADLADLRLDRFFDVVVLAGNVPLFCPLPDRGRLVQSCARQVNPGGRLVAGFSLGREYGLEAYDAAAEGAGLVFEARLSTWDGRPFAPGSDYAVSVHRRPPG